MNANEFKAQERAKNEAKFGRWASTRRIDAADPMKLIFEQAPRNELEAAQHGNALANTGNYPVGTSECFNVGISDGQMAVRVHCRVSRMPLNSGIFKRKHNATPSTTCS